LAQAQSLPAQAGHLQFGGQAAQFHVIGIIDLDGQPGIGAEHAAPVESARAEGEPGHVRRAAGHLAAVALPMVRHRGPSVADAVLYLRTNAGAVTLALVATQLDGHFAVLVLVLLAQGLAGAVGNVRPTVPRLADVQAVTTLRGAHIAALEAGQADVEVHAMIVAAAQAVFGALPPHAQAGGNAELAPALGAAEAGLPGTAQLWLPARSGQQRQQRHESGQRIIAAKIAPG